MISILNCIKIKINLYMRKKVLKFATIVHKLYGSRDGNDMDNFAMPWNIDKIFGMLEELIATNKATGQFFDWC